MLFKLAILFITLTIYTILTYYFTVDGTWQNRLLKSISISIMIVFLYTYVRLLIHLRQNK